MATEHILDHFAPTLRAALLATGVSQKELALKVGVSQQTVSKWVRAETFPRLGALGRLAQAVDLDVEDFFGERPADVRRYSRVLRHVRELPPSQLELVERFLDELET